MTIGELKALLLAYPDDTMVRVDGSVRSRDIEALYVIDDKLRIKYPHSYKGEPDCVVIS